ncbi:MAG: 2-oxoglutarate dehydrogenase E1 component [Candidatus Puniceispirillum sp.]|nr:2-oxoglutarate dehydrogenase E1 component [Candidatus Pelagibacter sp.]MBA4282814.1 2-oxoglutarate dehydrogenase E1 component [Candidatus Puniceispirillum sp.]
MDSSDLSPKKSVRHNADNALVSENFQYLTQILCDAPDVDEGQKENKNHFFEKFSELKKLCSVKEQFPLFVPRQKQSLARNSHTSNSASRDAKDVQSLDYLRRFGHLVADLNPLNRSDENHFLENSKRSKLESLKNHDLYPLYCGNVGYEFDHIDSENEKNWLFSFVEKNEKCTVLEQEMALHKLVDIHVFENFLHTKFPGAKRFSIEGCEALAVFLEVLFEQSIQQYSQSNIVMGMAHRGRLSILTQCFDFPVQDVLKLFLGEYEKGDTSYYSGDVKYHLGQESIREKDQKSLLLKLLPNPSHLEFINPVVLGYVRGLKDLATSGEKENIMGIVVHGDASVAGQGIVYESFQAMNLEGYKTAGTIHIVSNNQIGFTADPQDSRSTYYCTDIAKAFDLPIIHVNALDIDAVIHAAKLAFKYKQQFKKDIIIDLIGYRKYGHNEGDEPVFTQPAMYKVISELKPAYAEYLKILESQSSYNSQVRDNALQRLQNVKNHCESLLLDVKNNFSQQNSIERSSNAINVVNVLPEQNFVLEAIESLKNAIRKGLTLNLNPKLKRLLESRLQMLEGQIYLDWGCGEWVAYATILSMGRSVRISGQDSARGTFSHRHAIWYDQETNQPYSLFNQKYFGDKGSFNIWDSYLSELGVLGFEYGYSLVHLNDLNIWEAQFGDFANGAQVIIDQFIASGRSKWKQNSNLVLMLPHGFEGQGPEHSSARIERFLQLCAQDNIQVVNCTTPVSLYRALMDHVIKPEKRPLIIFTPKSLLRHKKAVSHISEFSADQHKNFQQIMIDYKGTEKSVEKYILCSGKIYYDLVRAIEEKNLNDKIILIRFEQLYPIDSDQLHQLCKKIHPYSDLVWCQEEPQNAGAWTHFYMNIWPNIFKNIEGLKIKCVSRPHAASTATGFSSIHETELQEIISQAIKL